MAVDIRHVPEHRLVVYTFPENIDSRDVAQLIEFLSTPDERLASAGHRFCDLSATASINLDFAEVGAFVDRRRGLADRAGPIKTAFLAVSAVSVGMVNMFRSLIGSERYAVECLADRAAAAAWLGLPLAALTG